MQFPHSRATKQEMTTARLPMLGLRVRELIPGSIPGKTMDDIVTARASYGHLDREGSTVRIRLNSTVVHVTQAGVEPARDVEVAYVRGKQLASVRAKNCALACYNGMIPYICPELPEKQKE